MRGEEERERSTRKEIKGHNHEFLVRRGTELWVCQCHLSLVQSVGHKSHTPLEDRLTVGEET